MLTPSSRPIRWNGRHSAAISPDGSVVTPYCAKQAAAYSVGRAEGDVDALAQVGVDMATVALLIRDDLDRALALQLPALALRPQHAREIVGAAREE